MNFIQEMVYKTSILKDLANILDEIDMDFTGTNGEEYFSENNISYMQEAIRNTKNLNNLDKIKYIIEKCKEYSNGYYNDFQYTVMNLNKNSYLITIAVDK